MNGYLVVRHWMGENQQENRELVTFMRFASLSDAMQHESQLNQRLVQIKHDGFNSENTLRYTLIPHKG